MILAAASGAGHTQRAFFFVNWRYVGTDLADASSSIHIAWRSLATVALSYAIYKVGEPICCPTGGAMIVRFQWTGSRLEALDPVPPSSARR